MLNEKQNNYTGTLHGITRKDTIKTYNGKQDFAFDNGNSSTLTTPIHFPTVMPDGSYLNFHINEYQMNIGVDINGGKKPNKLGHDIFIFTINKNNDSLSYINSASAGRECSNSSTSETNGYYCSYYALRDECPFDSSKKYFECLP